jgi:hypothetical protein
VLQHKSAGAQAVRRGQTVWGSGRAPRAVAQAPGPGWPAAAAAACAGPRHRTGLASADVLAPCPAAGLNCSKRLEPAGLLCRTRPERVPGHRRCEHCGAGRRRGGSAGGVPHARSQREAARNAALRVEGGKQRARIRSARKHSLASAKGPVLSAREVPAMRPGAARWLVCRAGSGLAGRRFSSAWWWRSQVESPNLR